MIWTIFIVLIGLWTLGMVNSYTMGGLIHIFLLAAVAIVAFNAIQSRKSVT